MWQWRTLWWTKELISPVGKSMASCSMSTITCCHAIDLSRNVFGSVDVTCEQTFSIIRVVWHHQLHISVLLIYSVYSFIVNHIFVSLGGFAPGVSRALCSDVCRRRGFLWSVFQVYFLRCLKAQSIHWITLMSATKHGYPQGSITRYPNWKVIRRHYVLCRGSFCGILWCHHRHFRNTAIILFRI